MNIGRSPRRPVAGVVPARARAVSETTHVPDPRHAETDTQSMPYDRASSGSTYREAPRPEEL